MHKHLYTFNDGETKHYDVDIDNSGLIDGETPVEDYGNYLLLDNYFDNDMAYNMYINPLTQRRIIMTSKEQKKAGITNQLKYIVETITLIRKDGLTKGQAITEVAKKYKVERGTITDKIQRRLNLNAAQIEKYLKEPKLYNLQKVLIKRFADKEDYINNIIDGLITPAKKEKSVKLDDKMTPGEAITL